MATTLSGELARRELQALARLGLLRRGGEGLPKSVPAGVS
jgi:hypothetical protein